MMEKQRLRFEHGQFDIFVEGNIVSYQLIGTFNDEGVRSWAANLKGVVESLNGEPFCMLSNELEFLGGTPEAYIEADKCNSWLNSQNMVSKAIVIKSGVSKNIQIKRLPSRSQQHIQYFDNEPDAVAWLNLQLKKFVDSKRE